MLGAYKRYDEKLGGWARDAEVVIQQWLDQIGYDSIHLPNGQFGKDVKCKSPCGIEEFFVEVERRSPKTWLDGDFPFPEVNIPERRGFDKQTLLFVSRKDMERMVIVFPCDIHKSQLHEHANRYVKRGELFRKVPLVRCLQVDMDDTEPVIIAERSRRNILRWWRSENCGSADTKLAALGDFPPYGMTFNEWRRLLDASRKEIERALFSDEENPPEVEWEQPPASGHQTEFWGRPTRGNGGTH